MTFKSDVIKNDEKAIFALRSLYQKYGYRQYKMSKFEEYDLYARNKSFLPQALPPGLKTRCSAKKYAAGLIPAARL